MLSNALFLAASYIAICWAAPLPSLSVSGPADLNVRTTNLGPGETLRLELSVVLTQGVAAGAGEDNKSDTDTYAPITVDTTHTLLEPRDRTANNRSGTHDQVTTSSREVVDGSQGTVQPFTLRDGIVGVVTPGSCIVVNGSDGVNLPQGP
ncbi:hypothetical protein L226DRAFT_151036 [Lentinus tigrinus ALCF2SS1-7]|uniref:Uncharacterized protein n=1 Tax=Lentinus tigrinus ALCF2SS1-6 TaxID=1328759 RepID=A0A5C2RQP2_9APHY|nr:hypothetical protein L227DRAFT_398848 [Lentinus tigrinus ALCF2SS1-6]RPD72647.1 hypothetical protein L226DRAFT_151036 [Lentinus tigrinus ALCF2SS1-7]